MYGEQPYARPGSGTESPIARITVEDLRGFVRDRFGRDRLYIGVVGDISPAELGKALDETFLALPAKAAPFELAPAAIENRAATVVIARTIPQSVVDHRQDRIPRVDPHYSAAYVVTLNRAGAGFSP